MGVTYFDDNQEIDPQGLTLLQGVLADLIRDHASGQDSDTAIKLARELIALFKSGFRSEDELKAMCQGSALLTRHEQT